MSQRHCLSCGKPEERKQDSFKREFTNLHHTTQLCVDCLIAKAKASIKAIEPVDYKLKQAGEL